MTNKAFKKVFLKWMKHMFFVFETMCLNKSHVLNNFSKCINSLFNSISNFTNQKMNI